MGLTLQRTGGTKQATLNQRISAAVFHIADDIPEFRAEVRIGPDLGDKPIYYYRVNFMSGNNYDGTFEGGRGFSPMSGAHAMTLYERALKKERARLEAHGWTNPEPMQAKTVLL